LIVLDEVGDPGLIRALRADRGLRLQGQLDLVRPGLLARLLVKGVTKLKDDVGFSDPAKMQVAIMRAGWARMAFAMVVGGVTRLLGRHGDQAETLLLIGVPDSTGIVHVRGWSAEDWSAPPGARAERSVSLLEWLERQVSSGRTMNQSLYAVRLWLRGEGVATR